MGYNKTTNIHISTETLWLSKIMALRSQLASIIPQGTTLNVYNVLIVNKTL